MGVDAIGHGDAAHLREQLEGLPGRLLVDDRQGEAHVDEDIVAGPGLGQVGEGDVPEDAAEVDAARALEVVALDGEDASGDG